MSSRILPPEDGPEIAPVVWRRVGPGGAPPAVSAPPPPDDSLRLALLQQQAEQRARESYATGLREGETAGRTRATAEFQQVVERLARTIDEIAGLRPRLRAEAEADLVKLSLAIARRVLRRELA